MIPSLTALTNTVFKTGFNPVLTLQQAVREDLVRVSWDRGMLSSVLPRTVSRNSLLEAKELLVQWRKLKPDTYPRGHSWTANVFQTTTGHRRKSRHISRKDCSFGNPPCSSSSHPLQILPPRSHFSKSLQKVSREDAMEAAAFAYREGPGQHQRGEIRY